MSLTQLALPRRYLVVAIAVVGTACAPTRLTQAPTVGAHSSSTAASTPRPPTATAAESVPTTTYGIPPLSVTSVNGITVELRHLAYGTGCIRIELLVSGLRPPPGTALDETTPSPISDIGLFEAASDIPLSLEPLGGGGGGGQAPDGSVFKGRETVYAYSAGEQASDPPKFIVRVTVDESLGFESPLVFHAQAIPDDSDNCGLQGTIGP